MRLSKLISCIVVLSFFSVSTSFAGNTNPSFYINKSAGDSFRSGVLSIDNASPGMTYEDVFRVGLVDMVSSDYIIEVTSLDEGAVDWVKIDVLNFSLSEENPTIDIPFAISIPEEGILPQDYEFTIKAIMTDYDGQNRDGGETFAIRVGSALTIKMSFEGVGVENLLIAKDLIINEWDGDSPSFFIEAIIDNKGNTYLTPTLKVLAKKINNDVIYEEKLIFNALDPYSVDNNVVFGVSSDLLKTFPLVKFDFELGYSVLDENNDTQNIVLLTANMSKSIYAKYAIYVTVFLIILFVSRVIYKRRKN